MKNKVSCIHSLASPFEYNPSTLGGFEALGSGPQGDYHVAVFFRNIVHSVMQANVAEPLLTTKHAAAYEILSVKGTVYGILIAADRERLRVSGTHLVVDGDREMLGDFSPYPVNTDKYFLQIYVDSADTLLVNLGASSSSLVVVDE